jgi:hypothetical protein
MIHIVFEESNVEVLSKAFELDPSMQGDIIEIKDDFAVGPIVDIYDTYGYQLRRDWWKDLLEFTPYKEQLDLVDDKLTVFNLLKRLDRVPNDIEAGIITEIKEENPASDEDKQDQPAIIQEDKVIDNPENKEDIIVEEGVLYINNAILEHRNITSGSEEVNNAAIEEIQEEKAETGKQVLDQDNASLEKVLMITVSESLEAIPETTEIVSIPQKETKPTKKATRSYKKDSKKNKEAAKEDKSETTPHQEDVWIWMGQNQHDVCGYYWLMPQLKNYQGRIHVLYLNNLPFINEKGSIFYPTHLFQIQPKEFLKAKKLSRPITLSEFEVDPDEWKKLCSESAIVRILEGGKKIASKEDSFYDKDLLSAITSNFQKVSKILFTSLGKMKIQTGDVFLAWRIRKLIEEGKVEVQGDWSKGWKEVAVKLFSEITETTD